jgi:hypothetical protein
MLLNAVRFPGSLWNILVLFCISELASSTGTSNFNIFAK